MKDKDESQPYSDVFKVAPDPDEKAPPKERADERSQWEYKGLKVIYRITSPWDRRWELLIFDVTEAMQKRGESPRTPVYSWHIRKRSYSPSYNRTVTTFFYNGWDIFIQEDLLQIAKKKLAEYYSPMYSGNEKRRSSSPFAPAGVSNWRVQLGKLNEVLDEARYDKKGLPLLSQMWKDPNMDIDLEKGHAHGLKQDRPPTKYDGVSGKKGSS